MLMEKRMTHGVGIGMIAGATIQLGNLIDNLYNSNMCSLCELKTILKVYDDSDSRWIIMDCMSCILPMAVWRGQPLHTMKISKKDWSDMENALIKVGIKEFGEGEFYIDKVQNEVLDHLHWHARPHGWVYTK